MLFIIYVSIGLGAAMAEEPPPGGPPHCFRKVMGGERLVGYDVTRIIERSSVEECEEECDVYRCTFFSFGNLTDGNGTCELTTDRQISRRQDPNFELYEWTTECVEGKPTGYEKGSGGGCLPLRMRRSHCSGFRENFQPGRNMRKYGKRR